MASIFALLSSVCVYMFGKMGDFKHGFNICTIGSVYVYTRLARWLIFEHGFNICTIGSVCVYTRLVRWLIFKHDFNICTLSNVCVYTFGEMADF